MAAGIRCVPIGSSTSSHYIITVNQMKGGYAETSRLSQIATRHGAVFPAASGEFFIVSKLPWTASRIAGLTRDLSGTATVTPLKEYDFGN